MGNKSKFFVNPILLVVIAALVVAAALIVASQFSARQKQQVVVGPELEEPTQTESQPTEEVQPTEEAPTAEEPSPTERPQEPQTVTAQPTKGAPDAPVTIVEFSEFDCPFCARFSWETKPNIEADYISKGLVKFVFRNLVVHGSAALLKAVAGECAHEQGKFWEFHDRLFQTVFPGRNVYQHEQLDLDDLKRVAAAVELDMEGFNRCTEGYEEDYNRCLADYKRCMEESGDSERCAEEFGEEANQCLSRNRMMEKIADDREELNRLIAQLPPDEQPEGIGTPLFFINGHILIGAQPYDNFKRIIDRELERAQGK